FFPKAFDALAGAVLLFGFSNQKPMQGSAYDRNRHNDGIRTHGQSADRVGVPALAAHFVKKHLAGELCAASVQRGGAAVNVVVAGPAGGQLEFTEAERLTGKHFQKLLAWCRHEFLRYQWAVVSGQWAERSRCKLGPREPTTA